MGPEPSVLDTAAWVITVTGLIIAAIFRFIKPKKNAESDATIHNPVCIHGRGNKEYCLRCDMNEW